MILLDTNVLIFAFDPDSPFYKWARDTIAGAVAGDGAAINAVSLTEVCVGDADPPTVADRIRSWGVEILDVPPGEPYSQFRVVETKSAQALVYLQQRGIHVLAATPSAEAEYTRLDLCGPLAVAVGTEDQGLSTLWMDHADTRVRIPDDGEGELIERIDCHGIDCL